MSFVIIDDPDGKAFRDIRERRALLSVPEISNKISLEANRRLDASKLKVNNLICTIHFGVDDHRMYKIFGIGEDEVTIALPDMVMRQVPKSSLYDPDVCEEIFWDDTFWEGIF